MRRGETDNCVMCRGESSCILPIAPAAVHTDPTGSRLAIRHFTEYLEKFPDDQDVRWLLNVAHMTLGEYPEKVEPRYLVSIDRFIKSEFDIGKFRDIGDLAKVNRFNMAGGAVMEDFDNDGLLDLATTSFDPTMPMALLPQLRRRHVQGRDQGGGAARAARRQEPGPDRFQQRRSNGSVHLAGSVALLSDPPEPAAEQRQWHVQRRDRSRPGCSTRSIRPIRAGPITTTTAGSTFTSSASSKPIACITTEETGPSRKSAPGPASRGTRRITARAANWIDYDNDDYPDLFVDNMKGTAKLYHNNRNGTFTRCDRVDGHRRSEDRILVLGVGL